MEEGRTVLGRGASATAAPYSAKEVSPAARSRRRPDERADTDADL